MSETPTPYRTTRPPLSDADLNAALARHVMGWREIALGCFEDGEGQIRVTDLEADRKVSALGAHGRLPGTAFLPATDAEDARAVLELALSRGAKCEMEQVRDEDGEGYRVRFVLDGLEYAATEPTITRAVCVAALEAAGRIGTLAPSS